MRTRNRQQAPLLTFALDLPLVVEDVGRQTAGSLGVLSALDRIGIDWIPLQVTVRLGI